MQILIEVYGWITLEFSSCLETDFLWEESRGTSQIDACMFLNIACLLKVTESIQGFLTEVKKEKSYALLGLNVQYWSQTEARFKEKSSLMKLRLTSYISLTMHSMVPTGKTLVSVQAT